ncbi:MAG: ATP synthase F0 subunit C [Myxococcales bacterium]|jgi:F-type H+-transporting ATPase subunit c|nr:ATP synthase F0 subunit C [Myxococcales bacterium]
MLSKNVSAIAAFAVTFLAAGMAFADDAAPAAAGAGGLALFAAAFAISVAAAGGAVGQGKAAAAALEGIARNPGASGKLFTPLILSLALIESLVIYALLIAFQIVGKA